MSVSALDDIVAWATWGIWGTATETEAEEGAASTYTERVMTMSESEILSEVQGRCGDTSISDVSDELEMILDDICNRWDFLQSSTTVTVSAEEQSADLPSGFRNLVAVSDSTGAMMDITSLAHILVRQKVEPDAGTIERVAIWQDTLYVHPKPSAETVLTIYFGYNSVTLSDFPDHFRMAIIEGICWQIYERKGLMGEAAPGTAHKAAYEEQIKALITRYKQRGGLT